jgi:hypothetical protein
MDWKLPTLTGRRRELETQVVQLRHTVDHLEEVLTAREDSTVNARGNPYPSYADKTNELGRKYVGTADWGNEITPNVIDMRAAFTIGEGIRVVVRDGVEPETVSREMEFIREFIEVNDLDGEVPQQWCIESQIEGRCLVRLSADERGKIHARHISWRAKNYTVQTPPDDYATYSAVTFGSAASALQPEQFVYGVFGGVMSDPNHPTSKVASALQHLDGLSKAFADWRKINAYFASPTPHFKVETRQQADQLYADLKRLNWRIGQFLVSTADFTLVSAGMAGIESVLQEISYHARALSGHTGIPVHFLGFPELLSNRATADNLFEMVGASILRDRRVWFGFYNELFSKALVMANTFGKRGFRTDAIQVEIPEATSAKLSELVTVWLPIRESGQLSQKTFLSHVPDLDVDTEMEMLDDEALQSPGQLPMIEREETAK